jgi:hypothetical protein
MLIAPKCSGSGCKRKPAAKSENITVQSARLNPHIGYMRLSPGIAG